MVSFLEMFSDRDVNPLQDREAMIRGEKALGALVETIICDGLDNIEDEPMKDRLEFRWNGPKGGGGFWTAELTRNGDTVSGYSDDPGYALEMLGMGHLKIDSYSAFNCWNAEDIANAPAITGDFTGVQWPKFTFDGERPSNAKPALPALQTVAGDKYRGLGWCDQ